MSTTFTYSPLLEHDGIRLLLLQPAVSRDDDLRGSLQHTTLSSRYQELIDPYTALSYVWGDPAPADRIILDGHDLGITANLGAALRDMRDTSRVHRIWGDAVCVNQKSIRERNQQVAIMGQIYSHANNTIIYLGPLDSHSEFVLRAVERIVLRNRNEANVTNTSGLRENSDTSYDTDTIVDAAEKGLLLRPWFRRIWVLQELVLSSEPWLQCGTKRVRWQDLCGFLIPLLLEHHRRLDDRAYDLQKMNNIRTDYPKYRDYSTLGQQNQDQFGLQKILELRMGCHAADPRDVIFAHLGLIPDRDRVLNDIKIDYNQMISEVFAAASRYISSRGGELSSLLMGFTPSPLRSILPSWVPDWGVQVHQQTIQQELDNAASISLYNSDLAMSYRVINVAEILHVSGVLPPPSSYSKHFHDLVDKWYHNSPDYPSWDERECKDAILSCWEKFVDMLEFVDMLAVASSECSAVNGIHLRSWPTEMSSLKRELSDWYTYTKNSPIIIALSKYLRRVEWAPQYYELRLALLNNGTIMVVPQKTSRGDIVAQVQPSACRGCGSSIDSPLFVVARRCVSYDATNSELTCAVSQLTDTERKSTKRVHLQHCLLIGVCAGFRPSLKISRSIDEMMELVNGWITYDMTNKTKISGKSHPLKDDEHAWMMTFH